ARLPAKGTKILKLASFRVTSLRVVSLRVATGPGQVSEPHYSPLCLASLDEFSELQGAPRLPVQVELRSKDGSSDGSDDAHDTPKLNVYRRRRPSRAPRRSVPGPWPRARAVASAGTPSPWGRPRARSAWSSRPGFSRPPARLACA